MYEPHSSRLVSGAGLSAGTAAAQHLQHHTVPSTWLDLMNSGLHESHPVGEGGGLTPGVRSLGQQGDGSLEVHS